MELSEAIETWENRANGVCEGISASKGGRAWLEGEFCLDELEALCAILKNEVEKGAA